MADLDRILETILHYIAMLVLIFLVLGGVQRAMGDLGFWVELLIVLVVAFAYQYLVRSLDIAPRSWKKG